MRRAPIGDGLAIGEAWMIGPTQTVRRSIVAGLLCLTVDAAHAQCRLTATPHHANSCAFYADSQRRDVCLLGVRREEVAQYWGKPAGLILRSDGHDVCGGQYARARRLPAALRPVGWDLSDAAGWPAVDTPPGVLAIDPTLGRFKFFEGKKGPIRQLHGIPTPHGNAYGFVVKGGYLFQAGGEGGRDVYVIDIRDPSRPRWVAEVGSKGTCAYAAGLVGDHLVVSCYQGMQIVDVSDPRRPRAVAFYTARGLTPMLIQTEGSLVYVTSRNGKALNVVDLTDPKQPKTAYEFRPPKNGSVWSIIPNGRYLYLGGSPRGKGGILALDISDPRKPVEIAFHPGIGFASGMEFTNWVRRGERLIGFQTLGDRVRAIDITDPKQFATIWEQKVNTAPRGEVASVTASGNRVYVGCGGIDYAEGSIKIYATDEALMNWKLVGAYRGRAEICRGPWGGGFATLTVVGDVLWASRATYGVVSFDVSDPANVKILGGASVAGECFGLAVCGDRAYAALNYGGLAVIDLSEPLKARTTANVRSGIGWEVAARGNLAFVAGSAIVDATDLEKPKVLSRLGARYDEGIAVDRNRLFYGQMGVLAMADVSDPTKPEIRSQTRLSFFGLAVRDQHLFVGAREGLLVFDVSDLAHPKRVAENRSRGNVGRLALAGDCLLAGTSGGVSIFDVADPLDPQFVSFVSANAGNGLAARGDYFYTACYAWKGAYGFFEMSDVAHPKRVGSADAYHGTGITIGGRYVYGSALAYIAVFDAPVSSEEPRGWVTLECQTVPARSRLELAEASAALPANVAREALALFDKLEALPADTAARCARAIAQLREPAASTLMEFFAAIASQVTGQSLNVSATSPLVPGYSTVVRVAPAKDKATSQVNLRLCAESTPLTIRPLGAPVDGKQDFSVTCPEDVAPGTIVHFLATANGSVNGTPFPLRTRTSLRVVGPLALGRTPYAVQIDNLHWSSLAVPIESNTSVALRPEICWRLPEEWRVRVKGSSDAKHAAPSLRPLGTSRVEFELRLPDTKATLGRQKTVVEVRVGDRRWATREVFVDARRLQRWHFSHRFPLALKPGTTEVRAYAPEKRVDLNDSNGVSWREATQDGARPYVDSSAVLGRTTGFVAYAYTRVFSSAEGPATIRLKGTRAEASAWLNGKPSRTREDDETDPLESALAEEANRPVLKPGWNELLVKMSRLAGQKEKDKPWGFSIEFLDADGKPREGLRFDSLGRVKK